MEQRWVFFVIQLYLLWGKVVSFNLTILHTNDVHARYEGFNKRLGVCSDQDIQDNLCFGGAARRKTALDKLRAGYPDSLFLDGGDQFQGTLWYTIFKWELISVIMQHLGYDAMAFGNHEFDDSLAGLAPFAKNVSAYFSIVNSNIRSAGSELEGLYVKSLTKIVGREKIGIVGYTTPETVNISYPGKIIKFENIISSLQSAVDELISDGGINKIIAIGHAGIGKDREICQKVRGIDVLVGGHTNTFLYTGSPPSNDVPEGVYPEVFKDTGNPCLVVQDYAYGKYLGFLQVNFDDQGLVTDWNGNPILLDNTYAENEETKKILEPYKDQLDTYRNTVVGKTAVAIEGTNRACRLSECNLGNLLTDAAIYNYLNRENHTDDWTIASICLWNGGGMRDFLADAWENITLSDLSTIMPFGNMLERVKLTGKNIKMALEHGVTGYSQTDPHGRFLQIAGLKVVYDLSKPEGSRVQSVRVRCAKCKIPHYGPLIDTETYDVITITYLLDGGDGHTELTKYSFRDNAELLNLDVIKEYLKVFNPVMPQLEDRISFVPQKAENKVNNGIEIAAYRSSGQILFASIMLKSLLIVINLFFTVSLYA